MKFQQNRTAVRVQWRSVLGALLVCSLLLLTGCGIPQLRGGKPTICPPETYFGEIDPENSALLSTAEFFNDPQLSSLIDQALGGNQQLRILAEEIQIAENEWRRRRGAWLPFFTADAGAGLDKLSTFTPPGADLSQIATPVGGTFPNPLPNFLVAADVTWQVDIWRQLRNARDAQRLRLLATVEGRNYVVTRLVAEIAESYYTLMALDKQLENLDRTITLQEQSLEIAKARKEAARDTELAVQRFQAEVRKNQSEKLIIFQKIVETENKINFNCGRYPQPVDRSSAQYLDLNLRAIKLGIPAQLMQNRPDIRETERELAASGLDIRVARANFYPKLNLRAGVGYEAFNTKYLIFTPASLIYNVAGDLTAPLINKSAIRADFMNANARQLQALYDYQRTILNAYTEVINRISKVENYSRSIELKKQQLESLEQAVNVAGNLFMNARVEYIDVLFAQRDRNDARMVLIDTKKEQLAAIVNAYQALGGGWRYRAPVIEIPLVEGMPVGPQGEVVPPPDATPGIAPPVPPATGVLPEG